LFIHFVIKRWYNAVIYLSVNIKGRTKMLRKCVFLSVVVVMILSLSACGGGAPVGEEEELAPPSRIVFVSDRDGNNEIYVMDADGSNQQRLTNNPAGDSFPSWSP